MWNVSNTLHLDELLNVPLMVLISRTRVKSCPCQVRCGFNIWLHQTDLHLQPLHQNCLFWSVKLYWETHSVCADWRPYLYPEASFAQKLSYHNVITFSVKRLLLDDDYWLICVLISKEISGETKSKLMLRISVFTVKSPELWKSISEQKYCPLRMHS